MRMNSIKLLRLIRNKERKISMSHCPIDHTQEDVQKKLTEQQPFLPEGLHQQIQVFLDEKLDQETLNEVFHLLKKYDLATTEVREERESALRKLMI